MTPTIYRADGRLTLGLRWIVILAVAVFEIALTLAIAWAVEKLFSIDADRALWMALTGRVCTEFAFDHSRRLFK